MRITKSFEKDIEDCYFGNITFAQLVKRNKSSIEKLAYYYYNKYNKFLYLNDEDDIYQIACMWMYDAFLRYDLSRKTPIAKYVIYNMGARIKSEIRKERVKRRGVDKIKLNMDQDVERKLNKKYTNFLFEDVFVEVVSNMKQEVN